MFSGTIIWRVEILQPQTRKLLMQHRLFAVMLDTATFLTVFFQGGVVNLILQNGIISVHALMQKGLSVKQIWLMFCDVDDLQCS